MNHLRPLPPAGLVPALLGLIVATGFVLRAMLGRAQDINIDESPSILAARMVAERGVPVFPSGILYLHGTTLSYLLAPLARFGLADLEGYRLLRIVSAVAGAVAVLLTFRLAKTAGAAAATALLAALLVAVDPVSVIWGGYVRMYALSQAFTLAVAIFFVRAVAVSQDEEPGAPRSRSLRGLVVVFWLAVFTHLATALLWPAMALAAVAMDGKELLGARRNLALALAACLLAPIALVTLTGSFGPGAGTAVSGAGEGVPGIAFLGEDNINLGQALQPDPAAWTSLFDAGPLALVMPLLLVLASGILAGSCLGASPSGAGAGRAPRAVWSLLALHWVPVVVIAMLAAGASRRYTLFLIPLGCVLVALAAEALVAPRGGRRFGWAAATGGALALAVLVHNAAGAVHLELGRHGERRPLLPAVAYVAERHRPGELVLNTIPILPSLRMGALAEMRFLPGGGKSTRIDRFTRIGADGQAIDYWTGVPAIRSSAELCAALAEHPGSWLIVFERMWRYWGYEDLPPRQRDDAAAAMRDLVTGITDRVYEDSGSLVFRSRPVETWSEEAAATCAVGEGRPPRGERREGRD